jgi:gephyrin
MDGYAVIAEDCPRDLEVMTILSAGHISSLVLARGQCAQITTGSPIPNGANAVVKVEDTEVVSRHLNGFEHYVRIKVPARPGQCIRPVGSDIRVGQVVACKGDRIGPTEMGLLASLGIIRINVYPSPIIALLSTGNELVELDHHPMPGQIRDSNRPMLYAGLLEENMPNVIDMGIALDKKDELERKIVSTLMKVDILITSGGVSMGEYDLLKPILEKIGTIHFGRVLMKPGKPCTFATVNVDGALKLVFGLPGNPVSSLACFTLFCIPCFRRVSGMKHFNLVKIQTRLKHDCKLDPERPEYLRAQLTWQGDSFYAESTGVQQSSRLLSFRSANGLLVLPQRQGFLPQGSMVDTYIIGPLK